MGGKSHGANPENSSGRPKRPGRFRPALPIVVLLVLFVAWAGVSLVLWLLLGER